MSEKHNYKSIYAIIRERIENGGYADGTLLPPESVLAAEYGVSRPTIAKVYNRLEKEHMVNRKRGRGTQVNHAVAEKDTYTFGLLLPGAGESEIFATINNRLLGLSKEMGFDCLWDGATASNADIRRNLIELCCENYIRRNVDGIFFFASGACERCRAAQSRHMQTSGGGRHTARTDRPRHRGASGTEPV